MFYFFTFIFFYLDSFFSLFFSFELPCFDFFSVLYLSVSEVFFGSSFSDSTAVFTFLFLAKLVVTWFFVVWLRMNLMRLRFDQVASYTWHELVIYAVFLLIENLIFIWLF